MALEARSMKLSQGVVFLAQKTGAPVVPIHMEYSSCWRLKSWDRFFVPRPFAKLRAIFGAPLRVQPTADARPTRGRTAPFAKCDDELGGTKNESSDRRLAAVIILNDATSHRRPDNRRKSLR